MELAGLNIKFLPGVGEKKAAVLYEELQVQSYEDMLYMSLSNTSTGVKSIPSQN